MCTQRLRKKQRRPTRIYPVKREKAVVYHEPPIPTFTTEEMIECQGCHERFPLVNEEGEQGIKIHCAGCNQFFHCQVAGTCYGKHCSYEVSIGNIHRLSWCIHCVPACSMNQEKKQRTEICVCQECFKPTDIYRRGSDTSQR